MYKLLIVDDEKMIREGMKNSLPWDSINIYEVQAAGSGKEALAILNDEDIDIMITDINMNEMTGIELIEKALEINPDLKTIVLTGYDYFEYAVDAIRLHVYDFLLKPIDEDSLIASVKRIVDELEEADRKNSRSRILQREFELTHHVDNLIHGLDVETSAQFLEKRYNLGEDSELAVAIIKIDVDSIAGDFTAKEMYARDLRLFCMDELDADGYGITTASGDRSEIIAILFGSVCSKGSSYDTIMSNFLELVSTELSGKAGVFLGSEVRGFRSLKESYNEARRLANEKNSRTELVLPVGVTDRNNLYREVFEELIKRMCTNITDSDYLFKVLNTFSKAIESYHVADSEIRRSCFRIITEIYYTCVFNGVTPVGDILEQAAAVMVGSTVSDCLEITKQYITSMVVSKDDEVHEIVGRAKEYINTHLSENISVSEIAVQLFVSPNYFSRLFKKNTGEGCNEYIVRKRMEKARRLLETTDLNTGHIAAMVGYNDTNYFSMAFKKNCGMSPTYYRNNARQNGSEAE